jgi:ABC-type bacteriocin/lantibiotic exporter with double-glycine peptidase domain
VDTLLLDVPFRTQFDGSGWSSGNCGPAALGMLLEGFGHSVSTQSVRNRANRLMGVYEVGNGTRIQDLARIATEAGLAANGPYQVGSSRFQRWTLDDVRREVAAGRPVVPQVYYPYLPNHKNGVVTDHYVVIVGLADDDFVFHDPADRKEPGQLARMSAAEFSRAWAASNFPFAAFSVARAGDGPRPSIVTDRDRIDEMFAVAAARYHIRLTPTSGHPVAM